MNLVQVSGSNLTYVYVILGISLAALAIAFALRAQVLAQDEGTAKMQEIAAAVQEGAAAYLARQFRTLSVFVAIVFVLLLIVVHFVVVVVVVVVAVVDFVLGR